LRNCHFPALGGAGGGSDDEKKKPHIRLAVENNQKTVDKSWARHEIEWPLRELAANIMRVSRGAGDPIKVMLQCLAVVEGARSYHDKCGDWPDATDVTDALDFHDPRLRDYTRTYDERRSSIEDIVEGALRLAAGRIVGQKLQEDHGEKDLLAAIRRLEEYRAEQKAKWAAEAKAARAVPAAKSRSKLIREPKL
jgi:hypothetical protein